MADGGWIGGGKRLVSGRRTRPGDGRASSEARERNQRGGTAVTGHELSGAVAGIQAAGVANCAFDKVGVAYKMTGAKLSRMRKQRRDGATVNNEFTEEDRKEMT